MTWRIPKSAEIMEQTTIAPAMTDEQIAARIGLSKARVFQLRMQAIAKIRAAVLEDESLREIVEELVGRRLPPAPVCETADCKTPLRDVRAVATREGHRFIGRQLMCAACRNAKPGMIKLLPARV